MANPLGNNGKRSDALTVDLRVRTVMDWITSGYISKDIINQGVAKWGVDERTVQKYIRSAFKEFKNARKGKINDRIDFYISAKMKLFNELKFKDTPKGAAVADRILESMASLEGLLVRKVEHTGAEGSPLIPDDPLKVSSNKLVISVVNASDSETIETTAEDSDES